MSVLSLTTTAREVFSGSGNLSSLNFKNGDSTGTVYLRNKQVKRDTVTSSDYEWSLGPGGTLGLTRVNDGESVIGPWQAISTESGGIVLEILPISKSGKGRR